ncbi:hypothetical protein [Hyphomicrobium sp.]|uniref:hypothetical protein n=1 Tax=Hyphomicrobium sp. TaxID=82 RepID=UPI002E307D3B|nr:hypothetical protein [Hyphomicrobium sp.]HEX2841418.1 hypothetical protein [Hyphomicrobium sp.]
MIASAGTRAVRWAVIIVLGVATAGMIAVSLRANFLFGYGFGQSPEKAQVFGWANVAADLWKVSGLILISGLWRAQRRRLAALLFPAWSLCFAWGMVGAIGVYAQDRTTLIGNRATDADAYAAAVREIADIELKLSGLSSRTVAQVDASIAAVLSRPVWIGDRIRGTVGTVSVNCTRHERATADACLDVARLREERADAQEAGRLQSRAAEIRDVLAPLRHRGAILPADPAAELLAWLSGNQLSVRDISFGFPLAFALLIEVISAIGPAAIVAFADGTRDIGKGSYAATERALASRGALRPATASFGAPEHVARWMAERTEPAVGGPAIQLAHLHTDYAAWCTSVGGDDLGLKAFQHAFDMVRDAREIRGSIRKFGNRYYGIRLVASVRLLSEHRGLGR